MGALLGGLLLLLELHHLVYSPFHEVWLLADAVLSDGAGSLHTAVANIFCLFLHLPHTVGDEAMDVVVAQELEQIIRKILEKVLHAHGKIILIRGNLLLFHYFKRFCHQILQRSQNLEICVLFICQQRVRLHVADQFSGRLF